MKKLLIHLRTSVKLISVTVLAMALIIGAIVFIYKPTYAVSLEGQFIGYTKDKAQLQTKVNDYMEHGDGANIAFVHVDTLPEYKLCLLKKDITTNDEEIFETIKGTGVAYYRYYAILDEGEEKSYVATFQEAEEVVAGLKEKNSVNKNSITILEKYEQEAEDIVTSEEVISTLYEKPVVKKTNRVTTQGAFAKGVSNTTQKVALGMSIIQPVSGVVTSRFGSRWGSSHKGIDIGAPKGSAVKAIAAGTVTLSKTGYNGGYGNYIIINHGNGVETVYGHNSALYVKEGQYVSQGQSIAGVGSTGRSTGNHLHLEIRINGVAHNPQNYLY